MWMSYQVTLEDNNAMLSGVAAWPPVLCQRDGCVNVGKCQAVEVGGSYVKSFLFTQHTFS